ncbi:hypothetical protein G4F23_002975 [Salmonella enterica]|nr:hypothetical protein [Salmonella enterica]EEH8325687.1 hypothetical protein [Salmonella enterica]
MTTNNHPAHGPVSLDRLHQISEILSKAAAQSDGGNLGCAMADAVKVIDGAIAAFGAEPVAWQWEYRDKRHVTNDQRRAKIVAEDGEVLVQPLYTAPPAPVVPGVVGWEDVPEEITEDDIALASAWAHGFNWCRSAMIQAGNFRETPDSSTNNFRENAETSTKCWCRTCRPVTMSDMRFVVCHECGNKRCPHANDHRNSCTGSNEPGQEGSAYPAAPHRR